MFRFALVLALTASSALADTKECKHASAVFDNFVDMYETLAFMMPSCVDTGAQRCRDLAAVMERVNATTDENVLWYMLAAKTKACKD